METQIDKELHRKRTKLKSIVESNTVSSNKDIVKILLTDLLDTGDVKQLSPFMKNKGFKKILLEISAETLSNL